MLALTEKEKTFARSSKNFRMKSCKTQAVNLTINFNNEVKINHHVTAKVLVLEVFWI